MKNIAKGTAHLLSRNILSTAAVIALIWASAFAAAPSGWYQPWATLDPDCAPWDTDCVVQGWDMTDDTWSMSGGNVVVQNWNVGIWTDLPYGSLHVAWLYRYVKVEWSTSDYWIAYCSVDVDINAAEASFPPTEPLWTECTDRDLDHSTSKYNKLVVADKYYTTLDYTTTQPSVPQCSWDTDNSAAEPSPIPNISDIGYECWDQRGSYYYHRKAILVKENNNFIVANNWNISINKWPNIIDAHALNVWGNISAQNYSPQLILQRSVDYGGYVQWIQTKLKDGTNNWFIWNQGESTFMISKWNYVGKVVVVKSDGNVWIGTTSPTNPLHVKWSSWPLFERSANGIVWNFNSDANNALLVVSSDNDWITGLDTWPMSNTDAFRFRFDANTLDGSIYNDSNNAINIWTLGNTNTMTIENGNIWIWRTSPTVKLDVKWTVRINNETDYSHLRLWQESNDAIIADNTSAWTYGGWYWFRVHDELAPYKYRDVMMLADDWTVWVWTRISESNSVAGTLDMTEVDWSVVNTEMRVWTEWWAAVSNGTSIIRLSNYWSQDNNWGGSVMFSNTRFGSTVWNSDLAAIKWSRETYNKWNLKFYTSEWTGNTEKMRIASSGNVWIWTTTPSEKLHVNWWVRFSDLAWAHAGWSVYVCADTNGVIYGSETACP